jgi:predicted alpha/beta hydrolase family esterase
VIVPRWGGGPGSDFYPWLMASPVVAAVFDEVVACELPEPGTPRIDTWPPEVLAVLGSDPTALAGTFVLGHSVGCQATLHALARLPVGMKIAAMLAVAGWWTVDRPWPTILPWQDELPDLGRVRAAAPKISVLLSDNDPFTAAHAGNAALWRERLAAEVTLVPEAKHFNELQEPAVVTALLQLVDSVTAVGWR